MQCRAGQQKLKEQSELLVVISTALTPNPSPPVRPSLNIDINRNACTFKNPKDLLAFIKVRLRVRVTVRVTVRGGEWG